jgi:serine phosphatase RsbU (regulator of sigma subunit)
MEIDDGIRDALDAAQQATGPEYLEDVFTSLEKTANSAFECGDAHVMRLGPAGYLEGMFEGELFSLERELLRDERPTFLGAGHTPDLFPFRNGLLVPFHASDGGLQGAVLFVDVPEPLDLEEFDGCESLATVAALAVSQARNARRKQKQEAEMDYAWRVCKMLLPQGVHNWENYEFTGLLIPNSEIGGDIYDFAPLDSTRIAFLIADATGKGVGPCLQVSTARAYFRALTESQDSLKMLAETLNRLLFHDLPSDKFITACFGWLDYSSNSLHYVNAGHGCIYQVKEALVAPLESPCPPLGMFRDMEFQPHHEQLEPGSLIALLTDGWTEREVSPGVEYGDGALQSHLSQLSAQTAKNALRTLYQKFEICCRPNPKRDDVTALFIRRLP